MAETFSTSELIEVTLKMHPVPPGTKSTRHLFGKPVDDTNDPPMGESFPPSDQSPQRDDAPKK